MEDITPEIIDLRGLEAPEPMEIILHACAKLGRNDSFAAHLPHVPFPIFPILQSRGLTWQVHEQADGSAVVTVRKLT